jgi:hypothetical protein
MTTMEAVRDILNLSLIYEVRDIGELEGWTTAPCFTLRTRCSVKGRVREPIVVVERYELEEKKPEAIAARVLAKADEVIARLVP